jgi:RimJ/RimL family protein N-acetyltransferase
MSPSGPVLVRPLLWGDFDDLTNVYYRVYDERAEGQPIGLTLFETRPSRTDEVRWFEGLYRHSIEGSAVTVVAEVDGHVVGSCTIGGGGHSGASEQAHVGELGILVDRDHRGRGVGSALLQRALSDARTKFEVVYLSVFSVNEGARRLYERFGFRVCGHLPRVVKRAGKYFDEERMVLDFASSSPGTQANR